MPLNVKTNISSLIARRNLNRSQNMVDKSLARLSTGMRITSAADDAAGLAISQKLKSQIRSLEQASRNANDGISLIQTAEGGMDQMGEILNRMRELAVQSANGTLTNTDRSFLHSEFNTLVSELDRIADTTEFNGRKLLNGSASAGISFQIGINDNSSDRITVSIMNVKASKLGATTTNSLLSQSLSTASKAQSSLDVIDAAIADLSTVRAKLGSAQNRLNVSIENLGSSIESLSAANARIRDVDVARETANMTKGQILVQAGISVLAQANQSPQVALSLLQG
ncbi:MAG: flagellin FliC [Myxococcales bacterium]|nr:flagellin FliC [Myxococcales bacterium]